jgi:hypothetical protein
LISAGRTRSRPSDADGRGSSPKVHPALLAAIGIVDLVLAVFLSTPTTEYNKGWDSDGLIYGAMADPRSFPPGTASAAPWCYRVLTPYLASQLPWHGLDSFRVLAFTSDIGGLLLFAATLRQLGFSRRLATIGVLFYGGVFWTLKFSFYSPAYIDYQTQLLLLLIVFLTLRGRFWTLVPVFALAVLQKESLAAFVMFSIVVRLRRASAREWPAVVAFASALPAVALGTLSVVRHGSALRDASVTATVLAELQRLRDPAFWPVLLQALFSGLGLIPVLLLLHYGVWIRWLRRHWEWAIYAAVSLVLLFGGGDKARLFLYFLPIGVILLVCELGSLEQACTRGSFLACTALLLVAHFWIGNYLTPIGPFGTYLARMVPEHSGGTFRPYLVTNLWVAAAAAVVGVFGLIGGWGFRLSVGFHRAVTVSVTHTQIGE